LSTDYLTIPTNLILLRKAIGKSRAETVGKPQGDIIPALNARNIKTNCDRVADIWVLLHTAIEHLLVEIEMNFKFSGLM
jgi:hypothetical protein